MSECVSSEESSGLWMKVLVTEAMEVNEITL